MSEKLTRDCLRRRELRASGLADSRSAIRTGYGRVERLRLRRALGVAVNCDLACVLHTDLCGTVGILCSWSQNLRPQVA